MKRLIAAAALFALAAPSAAQTATVQQAADDLAGAVNRITALEARVSALEQGHTPRQPGVVTLAETGPATLTGSPTTLNFHAPGGKRSYGEAYNLALSTGKPLLVWNGSAICENCVHESEGEFVSFVGSVPGCPANAVTVSVPENGQLVGAGVVDQWITSDVQFGHLPSARRLVQRFRANRGARIAQAASTPMMAYQSVGFAAAPPVAFYGGGGGVMMSGAGGGCASCGSSSAGRGFFGRR